MERSFRFNPVRPSRRLIYLVNWNEFPHVPSCHWAHGFSMKQHHIFSLSSETVHTLRSSTRQTAKYHPVKHANNISLCTNSASPEAKPHHGLLLLLLQRSARSQA